MTGRATAVLLLWLAGCVRTEAPAAPAARSATAATAATDPSPATAPPTAGPLVVVLGTVQDGGLPHVACTCANCAAARRDPAARRRVASLGIVLPEGEATYLIDATPDLGEQLHALSRYRPNTRTQGGVDRAPLAGVFLTHAHIGHYLGLALFGFETVSTHGLPVHTTERMAAFLRSNGPWGLMVERGNIALQTFVPGTPIELAGGVSVTAVAVPHRDEYTDTVGFRVRGPQATLFYIPDTDRWSTWDPPLLEILDGVDIALIDGSFYSLDELPGRDIGAIGHPLITQSMDLLQARVDAGALRVYFTHLNHSNPALPPDGEARRAIRARGFDVLSEGAELPL